MTAIVYEEKNALIAGQVRTMVHNTSVSVPKGQYFVSTPKRVIGIVNTQSVESATANVAMKMFRAVFISERGKAINYWRRCQIDFGFDLLLFPATAMMTPRFPIHPNTIRIEYATIRIQ